MFKELLNKHMTACLDASGQSILDQVIHLISSTLTIFYILNFLNFFNFYFKFNSLKLSVECMCELVCRHLPSIVANTSSDEQRMRLLPLVVLSAAVQQQQQQQTCGKQNDDDLLRLVFGVVERPNALQRTLIVDSCAQLGKVVGERWEARVATFVLDEMCAALDATLNDERCMLTLEACVRLVAPHAHLIARAEDAAETLPIGVILRLIKRLLLTGQRSSENAVAVDSGDEQRDATHEHEHSEAVRECAVRCLAVVLSFIRDDENKLTDVSYI